MQLPFVLQSAEVMKVAVAYLEPHIEGNADGSAREAKAKIVLATVKGDVHDIGKNLVDIILSNNGYDVVNIGIKQPISEIIRAADEHDADAIGMSGLLVKSTVVMKENLEELNSRGVVGALAGAARWCGADPGLRRERPGRGLRGRGPLRPRRVRGSAAHGRRRQGAVQPRAQRRRGAARAAQAAGPGQGDRDRRRRRSSDTTRSDVATDNSIPTPPFWGDPRRQGHRRWPTTRRTSTSGRRSWASGA